MTIYKCSKCGALTQVDDKEVPPTCKCGSFMWAVMPGGKLEARATITATSKLSAMAPGGKTEA